MNIEAEKPRMVTSAIADMVPDYALSATSNPAKPHRSARLTTL
jgi:hypothetical protein